VTKAAPPKPAKAVADALGDALPPQALARMGSNRFHHGSNIHEVKQTADGKWLISYASHIGYRIWEAATGKEHVPVGMPVDARPDAFRTRANPRQWEILIAPTGDTIVAVVPDSPKTTRIVDVFTGKDVAVVPVNMAPNRLTRPGITAFGNPTLSPDGRWLVWKDSLEVKPGVFEWKLMAADLQARKPKPVVWYELKDRSLFSVEFSADSKSVLLHFMDAFEVWETGLAKRRLKVPMTEAQNRVGHAVLSADGKTLALVQPGGKNLILWDVVAGKELPPLDESVDESAPFGPGAFSSDGRLLAGPVKGEVARIWDLKTRKKVRDLHSPGGRGLPVLFSPDGKRVVINEMDDLCVLDLASGKPVPDLEQHPRSVWHAAFTKDGKRLLSTATDAGRVWDPRSGRKLRDLMGRPAWIRDVALSPDGRYIATGEYDGPVRLLDAKTFEEIRQVDAKRVEGDSLVFTPDSSRLVVAEKEGIVRICDVKTGKSVEELRSRKAVNRIALTPDGKYLLHSAYDSKEISVRSLADSTVERTIPTKSTVNRFDLSPDGRWLATGAWDGFARIYELATGREVRSHDTNMPNTQRHEKNVVYAVQFSPDGRLLAAGCMDGTVRVWEIATGGERFRFAGHTGAVLTLAFSPDGTLLVSGSGDRSLVTWDVTGASEARKKGDETATGAWKKLLEPDAKEGLSAIRSLVARPAESVPLLAKELQPVPAVEPATIRALVEQLDSDEFAKREKATKALAAIRDAAEPALREAHLKSTSGEVRKRVHSLLAGCEPFDLTPERVRDGRAVEVLERIGSSEARKLLRSLAAGAAGAQRTREAKAALARLGSGE
jgi:WD40 repeat protein